MRSPRLLLGAMVAVATSPVMPGYARYVAAVQRIPPGPTQPADEDLLRELRSLARPPLAPPVHPFRLAAALLSFTDDHADPVVTEAFDDRAARQVLDLLHDPPAKTLPALVAAAPGRTFLERVLAVHAVVAGRVWDRPRPLRGAHRLRRSRGRALHVQERHDLVGGASACRRTRGAASRPGDRRRRRGRPLQPGGAAVVRGTDESPSSGSHRDAVSVTARARRSARWWAGDGGRL